MNAIIRNSNGDVTIMVEPSTTIVNIMKRVQETYGIAVKDQELVIEENEGADGIEFFEETTLADSLDDVASADEATDEDEDPADRGWTFEEKKEVVDFYNAAPGRTFASVKRRFRCLNPSQLTWFKKQVEAGGTRREKWQRIEEVLQQFHDAR